MFSCFCGPKRRRSLTPSEGPSIIESIIEMPISIRQPTPTASTPQTHRTRVPRQDRSGNEPSQTVAHAINTGSPAVPEPKDWYCSKCEDVFLEACSPQMTMDENPRTGQPDIKFHGKNKTSHHTSYKALRRSAQSGCRLCVVILGELDLQQGGGAQDGHLQGVRLAKPIFFEIQTGIMETNAFQLYFLVETKAVRRGEENRKFEITLRAEAVNGRYALFRDKLADLVSSEPLSSHTGSPESLSLASGWLRACNDTHSDCHKRRDQDYFPTRVLDLGSSGAPTGTPDIIRLFISPTKWSAPFEPYITLSHQWGASENSCPILKRDVLQRFSRLGVDVATLPLVFRDAIALTRRFGVRYLWIDRLCIIQDSEEDWSHEAQLMQKVYASSYCSIAASDADVPSKGCFFERRPDVVSPWKRTMPDRKEEEYTIVPGSGVKKNLLGNNDEDGKNWRKALSKSPSSLYKRGWVLQESILAPRILHCSNRQLYWECPSTVCCETFPRGLPEWMWVLDDLFQMRRYLAVPSAGDATLHYASGRNTGGGNVGQRGPSNPLTHGAWQNTVEIYTRCGLTYSKDKLIAISGIAGAFLPSLGPYCLGLWKNHLTTGLLWSVDTSQAIKASLTAGLRLQQPPRPYRAPSWSWASVDGPISFHSHPFASMGAQHGFTTAITVLHVDTKTRHLNGLGEVLPNTRASLLLEAGLARIDIGLCKTQQEGVAVVIATVDGKEFANYATRPKSGLPQDLEMDQMLSVLLGGVGMEGIGRTRIREQLSKVELDDVAEGLLAARRGELWGLPIQVKDVFGSVWAVDGILLTLDSEAGAGTSLGGRGMKVYRRVGYFSANGQDSPGLRLFQGLKRERVLII